MDLTKKQRIAFATLWNDRAQYLLYGGAGGGGKSWLGCSWLLDMCRKFAGVRYFVGRNNLKDTRASVLVTFQKVAQAIRFEQYRYNDGGIRFDNGSEIVFIDLTYKPVADPMFERLGSKEFTGGWIEEAGEIHPLAFEVLKSRVGRHRNREYSILPQILLTANPKKNFLYTTFYKPYTEGKLRYPYAFIQALVTDNQYIGEEYIRNLESITDKTTRERLLLGMWEYDDNPAALCEYNAIQDLFTNDHVPDEGKSYLSADVALKGRDLYVRGVRRGNTVRLITRPIMEPDAVVTDIQEAARVNSVPRSNIVVDSDGVGAYVPKYVGGAVVEFHGEARSFSGNYVNLKSECGYKLAEMINERRLHVVTDDVSIRERLTKELEVLIAANIDDDTKRKAIITKDKQKQILGHSPDIMDMLLMLMVFDVRPIRGGIQRVNL